MPNALDVASPGPTTRMTLVLEFVVIFMIYVNLNHLLRAAGIPLDAYALPIIKTTWTSLFFVAGVIVWLWMRGAILADYGLKTAAPTIRTLIFAVIGVAAAILESSLLRPVIAQFAGEPNTSHFNPVAGSLPLALLMLAAVWTLAAFCEEFIYRGVVMTSIAQALGGGRATWLFALAGQAVLFGVAHTYQGPAGMIGTGLYGFIFGAIYLLAGRNLWAPALAHGILDTIGVALMYLGRL